MFFFTIVIIFLEIFRSFSNLRPSDHSDQWIFSQENKKVEIEIYSGYLMF